jgi:hypothetical protein
MSAKVQTQDAFLRSAAATLGMSLEDLAKRMGTPWSTFERWMQPTNSIEYKELTKEGWDLVREIVSISVQSKNEG